MFRIKQIVDYNTKTIFNVVGFIEEKDGAQLLKAAVAYKNDTWYVPVIVYDDRNYFTPYHWEEPLSWSFAEADHYEGRWRHGVAEIRWQDDYGREMIT